MRPLYETPTLERLKSDSALAREVRAHFRTKTFEQKGQMQNARRHVCCGTQTRQIHEKEPR